ncbi:MAG TPA: septal ring lytic transglycosylase RlpA family protein [Flavobacterium sp.]|nr:septal ring lytic transglycosylase RlpA family protein [Flavobacterium sp.]
MKRQYYLILGGLVCLTAIFGFIGINTNTVPKTEEPTITLGKELAYATTGFTKDSSKLNEIQAEIDSELIKINEELNALEEEIEVVHDKTIASYYHDKFNGRKTASGEIFNNRDYTAAHKTLPFGTKVRVTNLSNDESIIVTITDRGPFIKGRQLDLSKKAFMDLTHDNKRGLLNVKIEVLPEDYQEKRIELEEELNAIAIIPSNLDLNEFAL